MAQEPRLLKLSTERSTMRGTLRSIFIKSREGEVTLHRNGKLWYTLTGALTNIPLVFSDPFGEYFSGEFQLKGKCEGYVELVPLNHKVHFNPKIHFPAFIGD